MDEARRTAVDGLEVAKRIGGKAERRQWRQDVEAVSAENERVGSCRLGLHNPLLMSESFAWPLCQRGTCAVEVRTLRHAFEADAHVDGGSGKWQRQHAQTAHSRPG